MEHLDRRYVLGAAGFAGVAALSRAAHAGPLNPPVGAVTSSNKTLQELADKVARTDQGIAEPRTPISSLPFTINTPGSYYLTSNLALAAINTNAITIATDNVTLDLGGFTLTGPGPAAGSSGNGILVSTPVHVCIRIRNGIVRAFRANGVDATQSTGTIVEDITANGNGQRGLSIGSNSTCRNCIAGSNGTDGITCANAIECTAHNNGGSGIIALFGICYGCLSLDNTLQGFSVFGNVENCYALRNQDSYGVSAYTVVSRCIADISSRDGFRINGGGNCRLLNCQASRSATGIHVLGTPTNDVVIDGNYLFQNSIGIHIEAGSALIIRNQLSNTTNITAIAGNVIGPTVDSSNILTNTSPHANYVF